jgi:GNAT superfamily N-acetyltransferase
MHYQIAIREGLEQDLDSIARVLVNGWRTTFRRLLSDEFLQGMTVENQVERHRRTMLAGAASYFVAHSRQTDAIVGFVSGGPIRHPVPRYEAELYALYLQRSFQGQGIGAKLVKTLARRMVVQEMPRMLVWVLAINPNRAFYERLGARPLTTNMLKLGPDEVEEIAYVWDDLSRLAAPVPELS